MSKAKSQLEAAETRHDPPAPDTEPAKSTSTLLEDAKAAFEILKEAYGKLQDPDVGLYARRTAYQLEREGWSLRRNKLLSAATLNHSANMSAQAFGDNWKHIEHSDREGQKLDAYEEALNVSIPEAENLLHSAIPTVSQVLQSLSASFLLVVRQREFERFQNLLKDSPKTFKMPTNGHGEFNGSSRITEIATEEVIFQLLDGCKAVKSAQIRITTPPHNVTRPLPTTNDELILNQWPIKSLRQAIMESVLLFAQQLLGEASLLFDAINNVAKVNGSSLDLSAIPDPIPVDPFVPNAQVLTWNQPPPNTLPANLNGNVQTYRENVLKEAGKTEDSLSDNERLLMDQLCSNFEENQQQFRAARQLGKTEVVQETQFNSPS
jgi:hypothetical protein